MNEKKFSWKRDLQNIKRQSAKVEKLMFNLLIFLAKISYLEEAEIPTFFSWTVNFVSHYPKFFSRSSFFNCVHFSWSIQNFMGSLLQNFNNLISTFENQLFDPYTAQRSFKVCIVCSCVCIVANFLKIYTLDFSALFPEEFLIRKS